MERIHDLVLVGSSVEERAVGGRRVAVEDKDAYLDLEVAVSTGVEVAVEQCHQAAAELDNIHLLRQVHSHSVVVSLVEADCRLWKNTEKPWMDVKTSFAKT